MSILTSEVESCLYQYNREQKKGIFHNHCQAGSTLLSIFSRLGLTGLCARIH